MEAERETEMEVELRYLLSDLEADLVLFGLLPGAALLFSLGLSLSLLSLCIN